MSSLLPLRSRFAHLFYSAVALVVLFLAGCESENVPTSPAQKWNGYSVVIESRPPNVTVGMNEFLIIANHEKRPAHDLVVSLRIGEEGRWTQAMQDGHVGVYRRAIIVGNPNTDVLSVHLRGKNDETVLRFPLQYASAPAKE